MFVLEDPDEDRLYLGRGIPRSWVGSGEEVSIKQAPTRWGGINFSLVANTGKKTLRVIVELAKPGSPREVQLTLRVPAGSKLREVNVNGRSAELSGPRKEVLFLKSGDEREFAISAHYG
jgi:hypothetical protein